MKILSTLDSKFICVPGPAIRNNLIFFVESSDLREFLSDPIDWLLFCEVELKGIGEKWRSLRETESWKNSLSADFCYLSKHGLFSVLNW
jgi:hypothetical protein